MGYYGVMCGRSPRRLPLSVARIALTLVRPLIGRTEPADDLLTYYTNGSVYPIANAEQLLGYHRRFSIEEGMAQTELWLRESGLL